MPSSTPTRPWQKWYSNRRWARRSKRQLREHPLCVMCLEKGIVMAANVADHIEPHRGNYQLFFYGRLQSLCHAHHNSTKQQIETHGFATEIGLDGFPIDGNHPFHGVR